jgi:acetyltransferase
LTEAESADVLIGYGMTIAAGADHTLQAVVRVHEDPTFGPALSLSVGRGAAHYELPPLNLPLAQDLAARAGLPAPEAGAAARMLVRVSQLVVDEPQIAALEIAPVHIGCGLASFERATISVRPPGRSGELSITPYPEYLTELYVAGGERFVIRPIRPEDAQAHTALMARLPAEDLRFRFFTAVRELSPEQIARLTQIDYEREMAFLAVRESDQASVGVARLVREMGEARGEFAIVVEPAVKGRGLARHLMERLIAWGRQAGLTEIAGTVLADNHPMLGFVRRLGFKVHRMPDEADILEAVMCL